MMSIAHVTANMGKNYYKKENYYANEKCAENSEWFGVGAAEFSLKGEVDAEVFQALLEGRGTTTIPSLSHNHDNAGTNHRAGIDLTFSAPKSLSLACLVGGDERLHEAHKQAVDAALTICQQRYSLVGAGSRHERRLEVAGNIIAAKFHHDTSRAIDPQLHTHCVVINAVKRRDSEWRSLNNDGIYKNSKLLGLVYQNDLARRVMDLGYNITITDKGTFEIAGYSEEQLRNFSKRRAQIEALGAENQRDARELVTVGRSVKGKEIPREELRTMWEEEAAVLGIKHPAHSQCGHAIACDSYPELGALVDAGASHSTERDVSFRIEQLEQFALENNLGRTDWRELQLEIGESVSDEKIIAHAKGYTTRECIATENRILEILRSGEQKFMPLCPEIRDDIRLNTIGLTQGQQEALVKTLGTKEQFLAWQGVAGAGKTFAMNLLREEVAERNVTIRGFAPSAEAARVLARESSIPATTVASLLTQTPNEAPAKRQELWVVDEAGLLSARDCKDLMSLAHEENARVIFVGDTRQLSAVGAGNPIKRLQTNGIETAHLTESRRQKQAQLKAAVQAIANGNIAHGLKYIESSIVEFRKENTRIEHVKAEFLKLNEKERAATLILAGTNKERSLITEAIRSGLKEQSELGECHTLTALRSKDLTTEELKAGTKIQAGNVVVFHRNYDQQSLEKGTPYEILKAEKEGFIIRSPEGAELGFSPQLQSCFLSYEKKELEIGVGDRVRWTKNDHEMGVRNGQDAVVSAVSKEEVVIRCSDGKEIPLSAREMFHLDHNYASTVYSSQGKTCENVIISTDRTFGKEAMYVAVSRAKTGIKIFTEHKRLMLDRLANSHAKESALDVVPRFNQHVLAGTRPQMNDNAQTVETRSLRR